MEDVTALQRSIEQRREHEDVEDWLRLWQTSQGSAARNRRLELMTMALPFDRSDALTVLDMCCGPGDVGRFIRHRFPKAQVDSLDRHPFLLALCSEIGRVRGSPTRTLFATRGKQTGMRASTATIT